MSDDFEFDLDEDDEENPFRRCRSCEGTGGHMCHCAQEHVVVAHCFRCNNAGYRICVDCKGWGFMHR